MKTGSVLLLLSLGLLAFSSVNAAKARSQFTRYRSWNTRMYPVWRDGDPRFRNCWNGGEVSFDLKNDAPTLTGAKATFNINLNFPTNQTVLTDGQVVWSQNCTVDGQQYQAGQPVYPDTPATGVFPDGTPFRAQRRPQRYVYVWKTLGKYWQVADGPSSSVSIDTADVPLGSYNMELIIYHLRGQSRFIPLGYASSVFTITNQVPFIISMSQVNDLNQADQSFIQNRAIAFSVHLHDPSQYLNNADISFTWDFGDSSGTLISRENTVTHTYLSVGAFKPLVTLMASIPTCGTPTAAVPVEASVAPAVVVVVSPAAVPEPAEPAEGATVAPALDTAVVPETDGTGETDAEAGEDTAATDDATEPAAEDATAADTTVDAAADTTVDAAADTTADAAVDDTTVDVTADATAAEGTIDAAVDATEAATDTEQAAVEDATVDTAVVADATDDATATETEATEAATEAAADTTEEVAADTTEEAAPADTGVDATADAAATDAETEAAADATVEAAAEPAPAADAEATDAVEAEAGVEEAEVAAVDNTLAAAATEAPAAAEAAPAEEEAVETVAEPTVAAAEQPAEAEAEVPLVIAKRQAPELTADGCTVYRYGSLATSVDVVQGIESVEIVQVSNVVSMATELEQNAVDVTISCQGSLPSEVCTVISDADCITPVQTVCGVAVPTPDCQMVLRQFFNDTGVFCLNVSLTNDVSLAVASARVNVNLATTGSPAGTAATVFGVMVLACVVCCIGLMYRRLKQYQPLVEETEAGTSRTSITAVPLLLWNLLSRQSPGESRPLLQGRIV